jgi:[acyl-carrier-protein] S-malonyltransferase
VKVAFCFPGQGSHELGMGRAFAESRPEAAEVFRVGSEASGLDLERLCFEGSLEELTETSIQQPALVTASLACLRAVEETGVRPDFVVGHSVGEYSALAACGALPVEDAIALVTVRGKATAAAAAERPGAMAAVLGLEDSVIEEICAEIQDVWPANYNCPGQVVVSGTDDAVDRLITEASDRGARRVIKLAVTGPFHSPLVASAAATIAQSLERMELTEPAVPFMSTVTARLATREALPGLLVEQLTAPVRFTQAVAALVGEGVSLFVEVGPGQVLSGLVRRCDRTVTSVSVSDPVSLANLKEVLSAER